MKPRHAFIFAGIVIASVGANALFAVPVPDLWWADLKGDERRDFIQAYTNVQSYFMDELRLSFEQALSRIDKLTGKEKQQSIQKLSVIVDWAKAQKRLADAIQAKVDSPKVWLRDSDSLEKVVSDIQKEEEVLRPDIESAENSEKKLRARIFQK